MVNCGKVDDKLWIVGWWMVGWWVVDGRKWDGGL